jgi:hypothetical protein
MSMANDYVTGVKNVLFLGAGASKALDKMLMGEFVAHLRTSTNVTAQTLFLEIVDENPDLEFLLQELEDLKSKTYVGKRSWSGMAPDGRSRPSGESTAASAAGIQSAVRREVFRHYRWFDSLQERKIKPLYEPLFERFSHANSGPVVVFTTNYDPAIERFCQLSNRYCCCDGFGYDSGTGHSVWSRENFDSFGVPTDKQPVFLFKLHGSADWVRGLDRRITKSPPTYVENDPHYENVMIYPATRKVALDDPYFTSYYYLQECLSRARYCLSIGYSFRDYEVLTRIRAATLNNPDGLFIQVLDPNAEDLEEELAWFKIRAEGVVGSFSSDSPLPPLALHGTPGAFASRV